MDSVTQFALGSAIGHVIAGNKIGRSALVIGGVVATLPDLDVFYRFADDVAEFTWHRGYSHSLFVMTLAAIFLTWLADKIQPTDWLSKRRWFALFFFCFTTHALLDACTVYGTQLWLPFSEYPVALSTLFVIDPLYTLPLLIAVLVTATRPSSIRATVIGLIISSLYLSATFVIRLHVDNIAKNTIAKIELSHAKHLSVAAPFTTLLWRIVVVDEDHYYNGYYSLFDDQKIVDLVASPRNLQVLKSTEQPINLLRLQWFTKDFFTVTVSEQNAVLKDLRMGFPPHYVFTFEIAEHDGASWQYIEPTALDATRDWRALGWIWRRIWQPLPPPSNEP